MDEILMAGGAMFLFVGLKAFQQLNVTKGAVWYVIVAISLCLAATEIYVIATIVRHGYSLALVGSVGFGSGFGCVTAMALHKFLFRNQGRLQ